jgi:hypothetical protein
MKKVREETVVTVISRDSAPLCRTTYIMSTRPTRRETRDMCSVSGSCHGLLSVEICFGNSYVYSGTHPEFIISPYRF